MAAQSQHLEWLSLIEVSGQFLAPSVLDNAFPQGLDGIDSAKRRRLRQAYEAWADASARRQRNFDVIHQGWIRMALDEGLDFADDMIADRAALGDRLTHTIAEQGATIAADLALLDNDGQPLVPIQIYPMGTRLDRPLPKEAWSATPIERMTLLCRSANMRCGLVTDGEQWALVNAPEGAVSGSALWFARYWFSEPLTLQAFRSLLQVRRWLGRGDNLPVLLEQSADAQEEITTTLGEQVRRAVEILVRALDAADAERNRELLAEVDPKRLYDAGLTVMMRFVFLLCAEERDLLPRGTNEYAEFYAISTLRSQLVEAQGAGIALEYRHQAWSRILATCRAVYGGIDHDRIRLPALGGSLFDPDRYPFLEGRQPGSKWTTDDAVPLPIDDLTVKRLLDALQVLEQRGGAQLLSYRALDIEQIGHVYEGLLEHTVERIGADTLALKGTSNKPNPAIAIGDAENLASRSASALAKELAERTGRQASTIKSWLKRSDPEITAHLHHACGSDRDLADRIEPFAGLLRLDERGYPIIYRQGGLAVVAGSERANTGAHYTPRSITERMVATTLEPVAYRGPAEGTPREGWRLKASPELLDLKICDPAMGSGAFLVQVCRWLAERVVEAWARAEAEGQVVDDTGSVYPAGGGDRAPLARDMDERLMLARRLIAERCLYGVDINPMAVELAKLSLWLVTLSQDRPFAFLDHNLRHGDSLLGIHRLDQITKFHLMPDKAGDPMLFASQITQAVERATGLRRRLRSKPIHDIRDVAAMASMHQDAERQIALPSLIAHALAGYALEATTAAALKRATKDLQVVAGRAMEGDAQALTELRDAARTALARDLSTGATARTPFHWALEFPEVFDEQQGGFDALIGNPPYLGGKWITGTTGTAYRNYLVHWLAEGAKGHADLVTYFFLQAHRLARSGGTYGLLACNTIAEGDTRQVGLERLLRMGDTIYAAWPNEAWPGGAAVVTSCVHGCHGEWLGRCTLSGLPTATISAFLSDRVEWSPKHLVSNANLSFIGSYILGLGFTMSEAEAQALIAKDTHNADCLFPYLNGKDLNSDPEQKPSRWVINFFDWPLDHSSDGQWEGSSASDQKAWLSDGHVPIDFPGRVAADYPDPLSIVEKKVKPERQARKPDGSFKQRKPLPQRWWQYADKRPALYHAIGRGHDFWKHPDEWDSKSIVEGVLVCCRVTKHLSFSLSDTKITSSTETALIVPQRPHWAAILSSAFHSEWAWKNASRMKRDMRYTPTDCFETFPFPNTPAAEERLVNLGQEFFDHRSTIMTASSIGLTKLYNRFHDPDDQDPTICQMRDLQIAIDTCVRDAYGWPDIALDHDFYEVDYLPENDRIRFTISEPARREVLQRLADLNLKRYQAEVEAGLHNKNKAKAKKKSRQRKTTSTSDNDGQQTIF